jgi:hypothetical protein
MMAAVEFINLTFLVVFSTFVNRICSDFFFCLIRGFKMELFDSDSDKSFHGFDPVNRDNDFNGADSDSGQSDLSISEVSSVNSSDLSDFDFDSVTESQSSNDAEIGPDTPWRQNIQGWEQDTFKESVGPTLSFLSLFGV